jgi:hypothetical protein
LSTSAISTPSSRQFGGTECSFDCHVPGPRGISPGSLQKCKKLERCYSLLKTEIQRGNPDFSSEPARAVRKSAIESEII